jgi:hypothetical protein
MPSQSQPAGLAHSLCAFRMICANGFEIKSCARENLTGIKPGGNFEGFDSVDVIQQSAAIILNFSFQPFNGNG